MFVIEGIEKVKDVIEKNRKRKLTKHKKLSNNTIIEIDNCSPLEIVKLYFSWCNHIITSFFSSFADTEPFLTQLCPVKFILYILTGINNFPSKLLLKFIRHIILRNCYTKAKFLFPIKICFLNPMRKSTTVFTIMPFLISACSNFLPDKILSFQVPFLPFQFAP